MSMYMYMYSKSSYYVVLMLDLLYVVFINGWMELSGMVLRL